VSTISLTLDQVRDIFRAGMQRGSSEQSAYEWGSLASGKPDDELADALYEIAVDGVAFDNPERTGYGTVEEMFDYLAGRSWRG